MADALNQFIKNSNSLRTDWPYRVVGHFDLRFEWYRHHFGTGRAQAGMIPYTRALLSAVPQLGSMTGKDRPLRFPQVDMATGEIQPVKPTEDTAKRDHPPILKVDNLITRFPIRKGFLRKTIGCIHAVEGVSLELRQGETLSLVGESGCGRDQEPVPRCRLCAAEADLRRSRRRSLRSDRLRKPRHVQHLRRRTGHNVGVLASGLDCGLPLKAAMRRASIVAALTSSRKGSQSSIPERRVTDSVENRCN